MWSLLGIPTGRCINGSCEVRGWCNVEQAIEPLQLTNYLDGVGDFSLFVRVTVNFYESAKQVIFNNGDAGLVNGTNLFFVGNLTQWGGASLDSVKQVGAVFAMMFHWECNLDTSDNCQPTIVLARLDNPSYNKYELILFLVLLSLHLIVAAAGSRRGSTSATPGTTTDQMRQETGFNIEIYTRSMECASFSWSLDWADRSIWPPP